MYQDILVLDRSEQGSKAAQVPTKRELRGQ